MYPLHAWRGGVFRMYDYYVRGCRKFPIGAITSADMQPRFFGDSSSEAPHNLAVELLMSDEIQSFKSLNSIEN